MENDNKEAIRSFLFFAGKVELFADCLSEDSMASLIEKMRDVRFSEHRIKQIEWGASNARKEIEILNSQLGYIKYQIIQREKKKTQPF